MKLSFMLTAGSEAKVTPKGWTVRNNRRGDKKFSTHFFFVTQIGLQDLLFGVHVLHNFFHCFKNACKLY